MASVDLNGAGVSGDDSSIDRRMFGVLNMSLSFWSLTLWSMLGLVSTGETIDTLSLSECSGLIDWVRKESITDSMNSGIVLEKAGLLW